MKYYLIAGEASGDLHASNLMKSIKRLDAEAEFRFCGGDLMQQQGGTCLKHYKEMAYMGFIPVLLHLKTIFRNLRRCREDVVAFQPDVLILVDYPGFNLSIAKHIKAHTNIPVYYYISPKIWAWKEHRIKAIKRDVDELFSILPFEIPFYKKHNYPIHYVGNPCVDAVQSFRQENTIEKKEFLANNNLSNQPIVALLAGSREQEIKSNLKKMIEAAQDFQDYQLVLAAAPGIRSDFYTSFLKNTPVKCVYNQTYDLLNNASAALVTSGTATLETALLNVPQVVCYHVGAGKLISLLRKCFLKVKYISLVNLIADKEVVREYVAGDMTIRNIHDELEKLLYDNVYKEEMLKEYQKMAKQLGTESASMQAAKAMIDCLSTKQ
jgi:lipid-A-disaccharide synthase